MLPPQKDQLQFFAASQKDSINFEWQGHLSMMLLLKSAFPDKTMDWWNLVIDRR